MVGFETLVVVGIEVHMFPFVIATASSVLVAAVSMLCKICLRISSRGMLVSIALEGELKLVVCAVAASVLSTATSALCASTSALCASASTAIASLEVSTASISTASRVALVVWVAILELGRREFLHNGVKLFAVRYSMRTAAYLAGICLGIITHDVERWWLITSVASALVENFQVIFERVEVMMKVGSIQYFVRVHREN